MATLGVDPDLSCLTASVVEGRKIHRVFCVRADSKFAGRGVDKVPFLIKSVLPEIVGAVALWDRLGEKVAIDRVVVEGQEIYAGGVTKNPRDILHLGQLAGALLCGFGHLFPQATLLLPRPSEWKGDLPKVVHHSKICGKLGIKMKVMGGSNPYGVPVDPRDLLDRPMLDSDWKHAMDSVGLALWGEEKASAKDDVQRMVALARAGKGIKL